MKDNISDLVQKGTTTVGIVCKDGIVLAADKRVSAGYLISNKKMNKIHKISDYSAVTMAGLVSDAQLITKLIKAEIRLRRIRSAKEPSTKETANQLANILYKNIRTPSMVPGIVGFLLGGSDSKGHHLYELGVDGSITPTTDFCSNGSGSSLAYGVLETLYSEGLDTEAGIELALKAIGAALQRDMPTGDGIDVFVITKEGVKIHPTRRIRKTLE
ncbi:proteasome subunit beta [archaeon]|jgi:proteasome beta subunit|nr:proteasome subunit beta [archaeon]